MRNFVSLRRHPGIAQKSFAGHLTITMYIYRLDKKTVKKARQQEKQGSATKDQTFQVESSTWNNSSKVLKNQGAKKRWTDFTNSTCWTYRPGAIKVI